MAIHGRKICPGDTAISAGNQMAVACFTTPFLESVTT